MKRLVADGHTSGEGMLAIACWPSEVLLLDPARRATADHEAWFVELCVDFYEPVLGYAMRRTSDPEDAADVAAEVFAVAWRRIADVPRGAELPWLFAAARRVVANHHRGRRRARRLEAKLEGIASEFPQPSPDVAATSRVDVEQVGEAFQSLASGDQEILSLVGWEGLDRAQLAQTLGCSRPVARVRLHRARRRFAAALTAHGIDPQRWAGAGHTPGERDDGAATNEQEPA